MDARAHRLKDQRRVGLRRGADHHRRARRAAPRARASPAPPAPIVLQRHDDEIEVSSRDAADAAPAGSARSSRRPKPNRCRTVLASASGPAAPATMMTLRALTIYGSVYGVRRPRGGGMTGWFGFFQHLARREARVSGRSRQQVARPRTRCGSTITGVTTTSSSVSCDCHRVLENSDAEDRDVHQERNAVPHLLAFLRHQARDDQALVRPHVHRGLDAARAQRRHPEAGDDDRVGVVEARDFRRDHQRDEAVAEDLRREAEPDAELAIEDRDRRSGRPAPAWAIGIGISPPARKVPSVRLAAIRFGRASRRALPALLGLEQREEIAGAEVASAP